MIQKVIAALLWLSIPLFTLVHPTFCNTPPQLLSPYFLMEKEATDPQKPALQLSATNVQVEIIGKMAQVKLIQHYKNEGNKNVNATYVFPATAAIAVHELSIKTATQRQQLRVNKRESTDEYKRSQLHKEFSNVLEMPIQKILPQQSVTVTLSYLQELAFEKGQYTFSYPKEILPQLSPFDANKEGEQPLPLTREKDYESDEFGTDVPLTLAPITNTSTSKDHSPTFQLDATIFQANLATDNIQCDAATAMITENKEGYAHITIKRTEALADWKNDYGFQYHLGHQTVESNLWQTKGEGQQHFLLQIDPPQQFDNSHIALREYVFIVDVSGSMKGNPLATSKKLIQELVGQLNSDEQFNIVLFSREANVLQETKSLKANEKNIEKALTFIEENKGGGTTKILPAIQKAMNLPFTKDFARSIVVITDGLVRLDKNAFELINSYLAKTNLFTFGVGKTINHDFIQGLANLTHSKAFFVSKKSEAEQQIAQFCQYVKAPLLTDIQLTFEGFEGLERNRENLPDLLAGRPLAVTGTYLTANKGTITITGKTKGESTFSETINVSDVQTQIDTKLLRYIWAKERIALLKDYNTLVYSKNRKRKAYRTLMQQHSEELASLGTTYNLLTPQTAFFIDNGQTHSTTKQMIPLPQSYKIKRSAKTKRYLNQPLSTAEQRAKKRAEQEELAYYYGFQLTDTVDLPPPVYSQYKKWFKSTSNRIDKHPKFSGGLQAMVRFMQQHQNRKSQHKDSELNFNNDTSITSLTATNNHNSKTNFTNNSKGSVWLSILIDEQGQVSDAQVTYSSNESLNDRALNTIAKMPKWTPAIKDGQAVATRWLLPVPMVF